MNPLQGRKSATTDHRTTNVLGIVCKIDIRVGFHIMPAINFPVKLAAYTAFEMAVDFDHAIGIDIRTGNQTKCINDKRDVTLWDYNSFNFDIWVASPLYHKRFPFWTGKKHINEECWFCTKCNATNPRREPLLLSNVTGD